MQVSLGFFVSLAIDKCYGSANDLMFMQKAVIKRFLTLNTLWPWKWQCVFAIVENVHTYSTCLLSVCHFHTKIAY